MLRFTSRRLLAPGDRTVKLGLGGVEDGTGFGIDAEELEDGRDGWVPSDRLSDVDGATDTTAAARVPSFGSCLMLTREND